MAAVEDRADAYREAGWSEVLVMECGEYFSAWEHERCPKKKSGKVFVSVSHRGEVAFHVGYITMKEARQRAKGEAGADAAKPVRPEVSADRSDARRVGKVGVSTCIPRGAPK